MSFERELNKELWARILKLGSRTEIASKCGISVSLLTKIATHPSVPKEATRLQIIHLANINGIKCSMEDLFPFKEELD